MKIVIETDDFTNVESALRYLETMQAESDDYAAKAPREYEPGYGPLTLGTEDRSIAVRVVGILHTRPDVFLTETRHSIQTIRGEQESDNKA